MKRRALPPALIILGFLALSAVRVESDDDNDDTSDDILSPEKFSQNDCYCPCADELARNGTTGDVLSRNISSIFSDGKIHFVEREEWGARPPLSRLPDLDSSPVRYVVVSHTSTKGCFYRAQCLPLLRSIQDFQVNSNEWSDIGANFLIAGDGGVYIGRGWDKEPANSQRYYKSSVDFSLVGTFREEKPTEAQRETIKDLVDLGVKEGKILPDFQILTFFA